jgi:hypothetical protein
MQGNRLWWVLLSKFGVQSSFFDVKGHAKARFNSGVGHRYTQKTKIGWKGLPHGYGAE